ncbi:lipid A deacylase LpxR family protein [Shewanella sp. KT0246]|uniref:lipid A deacylase LpxR family protein n=1 Tax=Shewanella sp. KT0246 TaxID=2815912 RepID=UPI001BC1AE98|nr:lipid A deacylase LpxR family protein [Shewanella sp. KT0246]GIU52576.1 membrane protein [Shewanella sp. KT0246]
MLLNKPLFQYSIGAISLIITLLSAPTLAQGVAKSAAAKESQQLHAGTSNGDWVQFTFENDAFGLINTSDDDYSNGIEWSWGKAVVNDFDELVLPKWLQGLYGYSYLNHGGNRQYQISYSVSQRMYTPDDLQQAALIESDRPYSGTLLWGTKLRSYGDGVADNLSLTLGVVGPASFAEQTQKQVHEIIDAKEPMGWDNQLSNEPVFKVEAQRLYQLAYTPLSDNLEFDTVFHGNAGVGNLMSDVGAGMTFRLGNILSHSYAFVSQAASRSNNGYIVKSADELSWQVFVTFYGRYVFNDITIDGNTFTDSHSAELTHQQAMINMGFMLNWQNWGLSFSAIRGTEQYHDQPNKANFAAVNINYRF